MENGQYWPIPIKGGFACGIVLDICKGQRKEFLAGLLDWTGSHEPIQSDLESAIVLSQGEGHIKMIWQREAQIIGKLAEPPQPYEWTEHLGGPEYGLFKGLDLIDRLTAEEAKVYPKRGTWGFNVINILADCLGNDISFTAKLAVTRQHYPFSIWEDSFQGGLIQYTQENCDKARGICDRLVVGLISLGSNGTESEKLSLFKVAVTAFNELNQELDCSFIETQEREELCDWLNIVCDAAGLNPEEYGDGEGPATEWRDW